MINTAQLEKFNSILENAKFDELIALIMNLAINSENALKPFGITSNPETILKMRKNALEFLYNKDASIKDFEVSYLKDSLKGILGMYEATIFRSLLFYYSSEDLKRIVYLLKYEDDNSFNFGGLRAMHFSKEQAEFLIPHSKEIAKFLEEYYPDNFHLNTQTIKNFVNSADTNEIEKVIFLLSSDKENYLFGGLKELGYGKNDSSEIIGKNLISDILEVLKAEYTEKKESILYATYNDKKEKFLKAKKLLEDNFSFEEAATMILLTKVYNDFIECQKDIIQKNA